MMSSAICNAADVIWNEEETPYALDAQGHGVKTIGEPTEVALAVMAIKANFHKRVLMQGSRILKENEFDHTIKKMSVFIKTEPGMFSRCESIRSPTNSGGYRRTGGLLERCP